MLGTERAEIPAIGIDLGTTYSCVGYWKNDRVEIIPNEQGNRTTPSYVAFTDKERLIGDAALSQVAFNPVNTIFNAKRLIGRKYSDESVQSDMKLWPFKVVSGTEDRPMISVTYKGEIKEFAPEEISSMVLMKMKQISETYIGSEVKDAVVTVPAYFNQAQRQATLDAGEIAGINVLRIINEPAAAAIAYGFEYSVSFTKKKRNVLVFDLGGGTFDVSILTIGNGNFEVKATAGDNHLGGEDFDNRMVDHYMNEFERKHNKDMSKNPRAIRRLKMACERAKRILSFASETRIDLDVLFEGIDFSETVTQSDFEELNLDLFSKCIETVEKCLADSDLDKDAIDDVVLVGGSSRIPKIQRMLRYLLGGKEISSCIHQDEAVAYGAAVQAAYLSGHGNQKVRNLVLIEVTPLSLGIGLAGEVMSVVIPRNTSIPATKVVGYEAFSSDNGTIVNIKVFEGERARSTDNKLLGEFKVEVTPMAWWQDTENIDVCFDLRDNGILKVLAKDIISGKEESISLTNGRLSREEINRMIDEANKFREEDEKHRKKHSAQLDFLLRARVMRYETKMKKQKIMKAEEAIEKAFEWSDAKKDLAEVCEYEEKIAELERLAAGE